LTIGIADIDQNTTIEVIDFKRNRSDENESLTRESSRETLVSYVREYTEQTEFYLRARRHIHIHVKLHVRYSYYEYRYNDEMR